MNERLYIKEMLHDLNYKDKRSIKRWCLNQNVRLIKDKGTNKLYVIKDEYEFAKRRNYQMSNSFINHQVVMRQEPDYKPKYAVEREVLSILQNI